MIPVYNAAGYLEEAVRSALEPPETLEVLLVEDGSQDASLRVCEALAERHPGRVSLLRHPDLANHGAGASRNLGIRHARGALVAFLDADDYFLPGRFGISVPLLMQHPEVDGVYEAVEARFEDEEAKALWSAEGHSGTLVTLREHIAPDELLKALTKGDRGNFCTDGILVRAEALERVDFFDERLAMGQDVALWWKLAAGHRLEAGRLDAPVAVYRRHTANRALRRSPAYREARLHIAASAWGWARRPGSSPRPGAARLLRGAYADAFLNSIDPRQPGAFRTATKALRHLASTPRALVAPELWSGAARRLLRALGALRPASGHLGLRS